MKRFAVCFNGTSQCGTTTGRPRRIGWLDITALKHITRWAEEGCAGKATSSLGVISDMPPPCRAWTPLWLPKQATLGFCQLHCECDIQLLRISAGS